MLFLDTARPAASTVAAATVDATPSYESLQPRLEAMHRVDAMLGAGSGEGIVLEKDAGGCDHQPEEAIHGLKTLLSPHDRATCKHPQHADDAVPEEDRMWGHGEIHLQTCDDQFRAAEKLAYVVAYDLHEKASKGAKRNAQFHRLFKAIQATGTNADLVLLVPTLADRKLAVLVRGLKEEYGVKVVEAAWPIQEEDLATPHLRLLEKNSNCCGWREFYKLAAWSLTQYVEIIATTIHHTYLLERTQMWCTGPRN